MARPLGFLALFAALSAGVLLSLPQRERAFDALAAEALEFEHIVVDKAGPNEPWGKGAGDINGDELADLIVGGNGSQDLYWYQNPSWKKHRVAKDLPFSTDHEVADVNGDGKNDIISITDEQLVWFRNPDWKPYVIATEQLHDVQAADFDRDGDIDLVARNQGAFGGTGARLFFYRQESPNNWSGFTVDIPEGEGLATADVDRDGDVDVIVNGVWLENLGTMTDSGWTLHRYTKNWDWENAFVATGDIDGDGRLDIVLTPSELAGEWYRIAWFEAPENPRRAWKEHVIEENVEATHHFVGTTDIDNDGHTDVVTAEMHQGQDPDEVKVYLSKKNGTAWQKVVLATTGSHSMRLVDIDNDGDMDLFGANWSGEHQAVELWKNRSCQGGKWRRHVIDEDKSWRSVFVQTADLDGDSLADIATGGWWYRNPGRARGPWPRKVFGEPANNLAAMWDLDGDGDIDVLATQGQGSHPNPSFTWAQNDGKGVFSIHTNIPQAQGDFLQGVAVDRFSRNEAWEVALSWHEKDKGIQMLTVPPDPGAAPWRWRLIADTSQDEQLSAGDIDGDGKVDLLLGTKWLRNAEDTWRPYFIADVEARPDRNRLIDMNGDGKLDAVVGFEAISTEGDVIWYEQRENPTEPWTPHFVARVIGPMSLDVADMDGDGDEDIVVGEHNLNNPASARLFVFWNLDGHGKKWQQEIIYQGDEHHDGAQIVDIDQDGDKDIVSIGWENNKVLLYENRALKGCAG